MRVFFWGGGWHFVYNDPSESKQVYNKFWLGSSRISIAGSSALVVLLGRFRTQIMPHLLGVHFVATTRGGEGLNPLLAS